MTKEKLLKLKASLLVLILCLGLCGCGSTETENNENENNITNKKDIDDKSYLITFVEGKAIIYENPSFTYSSVDGYASIYEDELSIKFIQTPCVVLTGKNNCIMFASSIVGEENIVFMDFTEGKNQELVLTPNN